MTDTVEVGRSRRPTPDGIRRVSGLPGVIGEGAGLLFDDEAGLTSGVDATLPFGFDATFLFDADAMLPFGFDATLVFDLGVAAAELSRLSPPSVTAGNAEESDATLCSVSLSSSFNIVVSISVESASWKLSSF